MADTTTIPVTTGSDAPAAAATSSIAASSALTPLAVPSTGVKTCHMVAYVLPNGAREGEDRPAVVVRVVDETAGIVSLRIFTDGLPDGEQYGNGSLTLNQVAYSAEGLRGTWHWQ